MYRFLIDQEECIVRFSNQISLNAEDKQAILLSLFQLGLDLTGFSHSTFFLMENKKIGAIVFKVDTIPSLILTVSGIIPKENWYIHDPSLKP